VNVRLETACISAAAAVGIGNVDVSMLFTLHSTYTNFRAPPAPGLKRGRPGWEGLLVTERYSARHHKTGTQRRLTTLCRTSPSLNSTVPCQTITARFLTLPHPHFTRLYCTTQNHGPTLPGQAILRRSKALHNRTIPPPSGTRPCFTKPPLCSSRLCNTATKPNLTAPDPSLDSTILNPHDARQSIPYHHTTVLNVTSPVQSPIVRRHARPTLNPTTHCLNWTRQYYAIARCPTGHSDAVTRRDRARPPPNHTVPHRHTTPPNLTQHYRNNTKRDATELNRYRTPLHLKLRDLTFA
jgi:hypothetical protein